MLLQLLRGVNRHYPKDSFEYRKIGFPLLLPLDDNFMLENPTSPRNPDANADPCKSSFFQEKHQYLVRHSYCIRFTAAAEQVLPRMDCISGTSVAHGGSF
jgi:hypothetical protein